jgi:dihydropyrimidinase
MSYSHIINKQMNIICVKRNSTNPVKLFGLYPRKGSILVGSDADIFIWGPEADHVISVDTHHMNVDYSMYEGKKIKGNVHTVLSREK